MSYIVPDPESNTYPNEIKMQTKVRKCRILYLIQKATLTQKYHRKRTCRAGAGTEATAGKADTPGFELRSFPEVVLEEGKTRKLKMPRNHTRVNQSSKELLQSWRGNCDIQILIYNGDPNRVDPREISKVTDYVVAYNCKGNITLQEERDINKHIILATQETTGDVHDLKRTARKILNASATRRLISKQEASVLLSDLPLTLCSDLIEDVSINWNTKITTKESSAQDTRYIALYSKRPSKYLHLSFHQFYSVYREQILKRRPAIPNYVGMSGKPTFPLSRDYACSVLVIHKPWHGSYPSFENWMSDFDRYIKSKGCSLSARLQYDRVVQRYYDGTKFVEPTAKAADHSQNPISEDDAITMLLAGMGGNGDEDIDVFDTIDRGHHFTWDSPPKVRTTIAHWIKSKLRRICFGLFLILAVALWI